MIKKILISVLSVFLFNAYGQIVDSYGEHHEEPSYLKEELFCDYSNYKEFISGTDESTEKLLQLRQQGKTCELGGLEFVEEDFRGAVLVGFNFRGSEFWSVEFNGANLYDADMTNTVHTGSYFNDLDGQKTILERTDFTDATHIDSEFTMVEMMQSIFKRVHFDVKKMSRVDITGANFTDVLIFNFDKIDFDSIIGLDKIICSPHDKGDCKALRDCSRPDNPYC